MEPQSAQGPSAIPDSAPDEDLKSEIARVIDKEVGPKKAEQVAEKVATVLSARMEMFLGPLPHPAHLAAYDEVVPGSAERIIAMAEGEQAHRHKWEKTEQKSINIQGFVGLFLGALIVLAFIGGAIYCAMIGKELVGVAMIGVAAMGTIPAFIKGIPRPRGTHNGHSNQATTIRAEGGLSRAQRRKDSPHR